MGRIMAIDYGRVRTGLAVTDPERIIAVPLATVETPKLLDYLRRYFAQEVVDVVVVGEAKQMDGTPSQSAALIEPFVDKLRTIFADKQLVRVDERFTSKMAFQSMIDSGMKRKQRRDKGIIDRIAATIILQTYMDTLRNQAL